MKFIMRFFLVRYFIIGLVVSCPGMGNRLMLAAELTSTEPSSTEIHAPLIVAHRGLLRHAPENTLANFRACLELRLGFEFDVQKSKDGELVCIHDTTVDRTTNGTGKVSELTLVELRKLDAGSWFDPKFKQETIPTIEEVLKLIAEYREHDVLVAVDFKVSNVEQQLVALANRYQVLDKLIFIGSTISSSQVRERLKASSKKAQTATLANNAEEFPTALKATNSDWVYVRFLPTKEQVKEAHQAGRKVFIAGTTVSGNLPENWHHAANVGIDGILTDYPLALREVLGKRSIQDN